MKRTFLLLSMMILLSGCITQVNTAQQGNTQAPKASTPSGLLPKFLDLFKLLH